MKGDSKGVYKNPQDAGPFFGRLLLSIIFIVSGLVKMVHFEQTSILLHQTGIEGANAFTVIGLVVELLGGILLLLGLFTRIGVYILMIFLVPATLIFHSFWQHQGSEMMLQLSQFLKNLAIYGGLVLLLNYGPGKWSLDALFIKT